MQPIGAFFGRAAEIELIPAFLLPPATDEPLTTRTFLLPTHEPASYILERIESIVVALGLEWRRDGDDISWRLKVGVSERFAGLTAGRVHFVAIKVDDLSTRPARDDKLQVAVQPLTSSPKR